MKQKIEKFGPKPKSSFEEYMDGQKAGTHEFPVPKTLVLHPVGEPDKIRCFVEDQVANQVPYFSPGIKSVNKDLVQTPIEHTDIENKKTLR